MDNLDMAKLMNMLSKVDKKDLEKHRQLLINDGYFVC